MQDDVGDVQWMREKWRETMVRMYGSEKQACLGADCIVKIVLAKPDGSSNSHIQAACLP